MLQSTTVDIRKSGNTAVLWRYHNHLLFCLSLFLHFGVQIATAVGTPTPTPTTGPNGLWEFRFSTPGATSGVLRARPNSTSPWGVVCDDDINTDSAQAACRSLGLSPVGATFRGCPAAELQAAGVTSDTVTYMDDVFCRSGQLYLPQCSFIFSPDANTRWDDCSYLESIFVSCGGGGSTTATTTTAAQRTTPTAAPGSVPPATTTVVERLWQVSLAGLGYAGLLRVRPDNSSQWGVVCDDSFGALEAAAACRSIFGGNQTTARGRTSTAAERVNYENATIYMDDVQCRSGQTLSQCSYIESTPTVKNNDCQQNEAVFLACTPPPTNWQVSLAGLGYAGLLRVRPDNSSQWGVVCDDGFGALEAAAACRSIFGGNQATAWARTSTYNEYVNYTTATIYMDDVRCGINQTLSQCSYIESTPTVKNNNCNQNEAVYVQCVAPNAVVTAPPTTTTTNGFTATTATPSSTTTLLAPSSTAGAATTAAGAATTAAQRTTSTAAPTATTAAAERLWEVSLAGTGYAGLLRVRPDNSSQWGVVCDDGFDVMEAVAACRSIFGGNQSTARSRQSTAAERVNYDNATIYMDDVRCSSGQTLSQCSYVESTPTVKNNDCQLNEAVYLTCDVLTPTIWEVSLAGLGYAGLLRVRPDNSSQWGVVCDDSFGALEAAAACRSIFGGNQTTARGRTSTAAERVNYENVTIYMDDVQCRSGQTLSQCSFVESSPTVKNNDCQQNEAVYVTCSEDGAGGHSTAASGAATPSSSTLTITIGPIVGGSVGGVMVVCAVVGAILILRRRMHQHHHDSNKKSDYDVDLQSVVFSPSAACDTTGPQQQQHALPPAPLYEA